MPEPPAPSLPLEPAPTLQKSKSSSSAGGGSSQGLTEDRLKKADTAATVAAAGPAAAAAGPPAAAEGDAAAAAAAAAAAKATLSVVPREKVYTVPPTVSLTGTLGKRYNVGTLKYGVSGRAKVVRMQPDHDYTPSEALAGLKEQDIIVSTKALHICQRGTTKSTHAISGFAEVCDLTHVATVGAGGANAATSSAKYERRVYRIATSDAQLVVVDVPAKPSLLDVLTQLYGVWSGGELLVRKHGETAPPPPTLPPPPPPLPPSPPPSQLPASASAPSASAYAETDGDGDDLGQTVTLSELRETQKANTLGPRRSSQAAAAAAAAAAPSRGGRAERLPSRDRRGSTSRAGDPTVAAAAAAAEANPFLRANAAGLGGWVGCERCGVDVDTDRHKYCTNCGARAHARVKENVLLSKNAPLLSRLAVLKRSMGDVYVSDVGVVAARMAGHHVAPEEVPEEMKDSVIAQQKQAIGTLRRYVETQALVTAEQALQLDQMQIAAADDLSSVSDTTLMLGDLDSLSSSADEGRATRQRRPQQKQPQQQAQRRQPRGSVDTSPDSSAGSWGFSPRKETSKGSGGGGGGGGASKTQEIEELRGYVQSLTKGTYIEHLQGKMVGLKKEVCRLRRWADKKRHAERRNVQNLRGWVDSQARYGAERAAEDEEKIRRRTERVAKAKALQQEHRQQTLADEAAERVRQSEKTGAFAALYDGQEEEEDDDEDDGDVPDPALLFCPEELERALDDQMGTTAAAAAAATQRRGHWPSASAQEEALRTRVDAEGGNSHVHVSSKKQQSSKTRSERGEEDGKGARRRRRKARKESERKKKEKKERWKKEKKKRSHAKRKHRSRRRSSSSSSSSSSGGSSDSGSTTSTSTTSTSSHTAWTLSHPHEAAHTASEDRAKQTPPTAEHRGGTFAVSPSFALSDNERNAAAAAAAASTQHNRQTIAAGIWGDGDDNTGNGLARYYPHSVAAVREPQPVAVPVAAAAATSAAYRPSRHYSPPAHASALLPPDLPRQQHGYPSQPHPRPPFQERQYPHHQQPYSHDYAPPPPNPYASAHARAHAPFGGGGGAHLLPSPLPPPPPEFDARAYTSPAAAAAAAAASASATAAWGRDGGGVGSGVGGGSSENGDVPATQTRSSHRTVASRPKESPASQPRSQQWSPASVPSSSPAAALPPPATRVGGIARSESCSSFANLAGLSASRTSRAPMPR